MILFPNRYKKWIYKMKKILIVDDDASIGNMLEEMLIKEGYAVLRAYSGTEALLVLREDRPDLVLLDLMLPGLSGEEILPYMQDIPVIVMSAKADVEDKVELLLGGAVDYVTKPFSGKELMARIAVQLRMRQQKNEKNNDTEINTGDIITYDTKSEIGCEIDQNSNKNKAGTILKHDLITLNTANLQCFAGDREVRLTRTEFAILKLLMSNPTQIIPRSMMLEYISMDTPDCTESSLKVHVSHLRGKLREVTGKDYVEAVWGIGFRLCTDLTNS